jgi:pilus assembly protein Flp/PilA
MRGVVRKFWSDENGATAIEYGLIASLIAIVAIAAFKMVGSHLSTTFNQVAGNLQ